MDFINLIFKRQSCTFQIDEDTFAKRAQSIAFIMHEALLNQKFLQTKTQIKKWNMYYGL